MPGNKWLQFYLKCSNTAQTRLKTDPLRTPEIANSKAGPIHPKNNQIISATRKLSQIERGTNKYVTA
jgi:hypothetical protein